MFSDDGKVYERMGWVMPQIVIPDPILEFCRWPVSVSARTAFNSSKYLHLHSYSVSVSSHYHFWRLITLLIFHDAFLLAYAVDTPLLITKSLGHT